VRSFSPFYELQDKEAVDFSSQCPKLDVWVDIQGLKRKESTERPVITGIYPRIYPSINELVPHRVILDEDTIYFSFPPWWRLLCSSPACPDPPGLHRASRSGSEDSSFFFPWTAWLWKIPSNKCSDPRRLASVLSQSILIDPWGPLCKTVFFFFHPQVLAPVWQSPSYRRKKRKKKNRGTILNLKSMKILCWRESSIFPNQHHNYRKWVVIAKGRIKVPCELLYFSDKLLIFKDFAANMKYISIRSEHSWRVHHMTKGFPSRI
jgi:hypothetical protein